MEKEGNIFYKQNNMPVKEFDYLTLLEIHNLIYEDNTIIKINKNKEESKNIPIVNQIKYLLKEIETEKNGMKLTPAGYLPSKVVKELYNQKYISDYIIEEGIVKLTKEIDSNTVRLTRIVCEVSGLIRKRYNKLYLTKKAKKMIESSDFVEFLIDAFGNKLNLSYFDRYLDTDIANVGYKYSLYLLSKYGDKERDSEFYGEKYFTAFPKLLTMDMTDAIKCYSLRTFQRFLNYFNFVELKINKLLTPTTVKKTELFDKYVSIEFDSLFD